ncbi:hypothetical protein [Anaerosporobacter sp.]|uniref:hypothetical protein n=1 Tax=Anaerosporobacter sp. TaxID=1872529 RepID=UPI00286F27ED|nr:hypothetical protein [Anaerosporobacter sp.]
MYKKIDELCCIDEDAFGGIPGLDLDVKKEECVRRNYVPSFIVMRVLPKNREDIRQLLEELDMDHYDPFEYLIRTPMRAGQDNLIVERA